MTKTTSAAFRAAIDALTADTRKGMVDTTSKAKACIDRIKPIAGKIDALNAEIARRQRAGVRVTVAAHSIHDQHAALLREIIDQRTAAADWLGATVTALVATCARQTELLTAAAATIEAFEVNEAERVAEKAAADAAKAAEAGMYRRTGPR